MRSVGNLVHQVRMFRDMTSKFKLRSYIILFNEIQLDYRDSLKPKSSKKPVLPTPYSKLVFYINPAHDSNLSRSVFCSSLHFRPRLFQIIPWREKHSQWRDCAWSSVISYRPRPVNNYKFTCSSQSVMFCHHPSLHVANQDTPTKLLAPCTEMNKNGSILKINKYLHKSFHTRNPNNTPFKHFDFIKTGIFVL